MVNAARKCQNGCCQWVSGTGMVFGRSFINKFDYLTTGRGQVMDNIEYVCIDEKLAKRLMDAGLDCVDVRYAIPARIAELFGGLSGVDISKAEPEKAPKKKKKITRGPTVYKFKLAPDSRNRFSRMAVGSESKKAAEICINSIEKYGCATRVISKDLLHDWWRSSGISKEFIKYGSGGMIKSGILIAANGEQL